MAIMMANTIRHALLSLPGMSGLNLASDWMHVKYLGCDQYVLASVLYLLTHTLLPGCRFSKCYAHSARQNEQTAGCLRHPFYDASPERQDRELLFRNNAWAARSHKEASCTANTYFAPNVKPVAWQRGTNDAPKMHQIGTLDAPRRHRWVYGTRCSKDHIEHSLDFSCGLFDVFCCDDSHRSCFDYFYHYSIAFSHICI